MGGLAYCFVCSPDADKWISLLVLYILTCIFTLWQENLNGVRIFLFSQLYEDIMKELDFSEILELCGLIKGRKKSLDFAFSLKK